MGGRESSSQRISIYEIVLIKIDERTDLIKRKFLVICFLKTDDSVWIVRKF